MNSNIASRVLSIEDSPETQHLISLMLRKSPFELVFAENGQIGVELALESQKIKKPFDAILMDILMPVLDGYQATRKLRSEGYTGPIIAVTACAMHGDREKCLDAGCSGYLAKPVDQQQLINLLISQIASAKTPSLTK